MPRNQRLIFLAVAVAIAVIAVVVLASGGDDEETTATTSAPTVTVTASATGTAEATPAADVPVLTADNPQTLEFKEGDTIAFKVQSDKADEVHFHGYDVKKDVEAGGEVEFSVPAKIVGIFEVELEDAGVKLGQVRVDPK
jgi:Flp pilus assembly protein CpaB